MSRIQQSFALFVHKYTDHIANTSTSTPLRSEDLTLERQGWWYAGVLVFLLGGYLFFDRAFGHLHMPGTPLFLAEPILALGLVLALRSKATKRLVRFSVPTRALIGFMAWGFFLFFFGVFDWGIDAVQDGALWYYGLYAIVVAALVLANNDLLDKLIPVYAGALAVFAVAGWVRLSMATNKGDNLPDSLVPWTGHREGNIAIHAAVGFAFVVLLLAPWLAERFDRMVAIAIVSGFALALLALYIGAATQNRGGLVAGFLILVGVPLVSRDFGLAAAMLSLVIVVTLGVLYISDASVEMGRRDLSVRQLIDNIVSVREGEDTGRIDFWSPVVDDILTQEHFLNGLGFGENLGDRYEFKDFRGQADPLRNVHNSQLNVLARMGVVGVGFWLAVWGFWYYHIFRARARLRMVDSPRRAAFLGWAMLAVTAMLVNSFFDGTLEGPQVAVWMWSIVGLGTAIALEANVREWQRRRGGYEGGRDIAREGGQENPLGWSLSQLKRSSKRARRRY